MMSDLHLISLVLSALLSENFVLVLCVGFGTNPEAFIDPQQGRRTGFCLTAVMVVSTMLSRGVDYFLTQSGLSFFRLPAFALLVIGVVGGLTWVLRNMLPDLYKTSGREMASLATNAAALCCVLLSSIRSYDLAQSFTFSLFGGLGATFVMVCCAGLREEVSFDSCPKNFRGFPILLITLGLMALAMLGFYGLHFD